MLLQNGQPSGRTTGPRLFCTDCHNSDDNREFGGTGANGPHGSATCTCSSATISSARLPCPADW